LTGVATADIRYFEKDARQVYAFWMGEVIDAPARVFFSTTNFGGEVKSLATSLLVITEKRNDS